MFRTRLTLVAACLLAACWSEPEPRVSPEAPATRVEVPEATPDAEAVEIAVVEVVTAPERWRGKQISGRATVAAVPTDRGFWLEKDGNRLFAILNDAPSDAHVDINPGQVLQIDTATVRTQQDIDALASSAEGLTEDSKAILSGQPVFIQVDESAVHIVEKG